MKADAPLLAVDDLHVRFPAAGTGLFGLGKREVRAVDGASLVLRPGETLGLVGESGSGKSTLGRAILGLVEGSGGRIVFDGTTLGQGPASDLARLRRETAMIFQDPFGSLNPRQSVGDAIAEVLAVHGKVPPSGIAERVRELFSLVGLDPALAGRRPHALSGGQCQRVGIARALAVEPRLVIADECVAALDVSIQGQIINLLMDLQARMRLAMIFIAHDLAIVRRLCDRVAVMYLGRIVEEGPTEAIFRTPRHPYTAALIGAIPEIDPDVGLPSQPLGGDPPSPLDVPEGCAFHPRCDFVREVCRQGPPPRERRDGARRWSCVLEAGVINKSSQPERAIP